MTAPGADVQLLLRAARRDAPSAATKEAMYARIAAQTAGAAAAAPLVSKLFGAKLLVGLASVAVAVGLVAFIAPKLKAPTLGPDPVVTIDRTHVTGSGGAADEPAGFRPPSSLVALQSHAPPAPGKSTPVVIVDGDAIEREARWVAEARTALMRGEPAVAATKARAARALPSKLLEPEELRILGRALRVMGDDRGADAAFAELVAKYPEEALRP
jgi:hypothetical protein